MLFAPRRKVMIQVGSWFARMDTVSCNQRLHGDNTKRFMIEGIIYSEKKKKDCSVVHHPDAKLELFVTIWRNGNTAIKQINISKTKPLDDEAVQLESLFLSLWQAHGVCNWNIWNMLVSETMGVYTKLVLFDVQSSLRRSKLENRWHEAKLYSCPKASGSLNRHLRCPKCSSYRCQKQLQRFFKWPAGARNVAATGAWSCAGEDILMILIVVFAQILPKIPWHFYVYTKDFSRSYVDFLTGDVLPRGRMFQKTRPERLWVPRSRRLPGVLSNPEKPLENIGKLPWILGTGIKENTDREFFWTFYEYIHANIPYFNIRTLTGYLEFVHGMECPWYGWTINANIQKWQWLTKQNDHPMGSLVGAGPTLGSSVSFLMCFFCRKSKIHDPNYVPINSDHLLVQWIQPTRLNKWASLLFHCSNSQIIFWKLVSIGSFFCSFL